VHISATIKGQVVVIEQAASDIMNRLFTAMIGALDILPSTRQLVFALPTPPAVPNALPIFTVPNYGAVSLAPRAVCSHEAFQLLPRNHLWHYFSHTHTPKPIKTQSWHRERKKAQLTTRPRRAKLLLPRARPRLARLLQSLKAKLARLLLQSLKARLASLPYPSSPTRQSPSSSTAI
jgi:hypothetical protein